MINAVQGVPTSIPMGLYRCFTGEYFYVTGVSRALEDPCRITRVHYFNVCKPELGVYSRPIVEFVGSNSHYERDYKGDYFDTGIEIKKRSDNVTGQVHRFERVKDLNFQLGSISTEQLIDELRKRVDSPIHELDIEGLRSPVFCSDYVVGVKHDATEEHPAGIDTINVFFDEGKAREYFVNQITARPKIGMFKRTFIELQD